MIELGVIDILITFIKIYERQNSTYVYTIQMILQKHSYQKDLRQREHFAHDLIISHEINLFH